MILVPARVRVVTVQGALEGGHDVVFTADRRESVAGRLADEARGIRECLHQQVDPDEGAGVGGALATGGRAALCPGAR